jgi:hypothetical protein
VHTVKLEDLLSKLSNISVSINKIAMGSQTLYLLHCKLPEFPFGGREHVWYPLLVSDGQESIDREEVDAMLRHLWHSEQEFFPDDEEEQSEGARSGL